MILPMLLVVASTVSSQECASVSVIAGKIMNAHQSGVEISKLLSSIDNTNNPETLKAALKATVRDVYKTPRYVTRSEQQGAVSEYKNNVFLQCMRLNN